MANNKATEGKLSTLHGAIAQVMTSQVLMTEEATEINNDGELVGTGEQMYNATPALLAVAAKFLKDNSITADVAMDTNLSGLKDVLDKKQLNSRRALPDPTEVAKAH